MIIATSGHVDHGKTSLVRNLTNIETDNLEEEKARGLTIDLGYAYIQQEKTDDSENNLSIGFVDVPGHSRFISNMLAGVAGIDFGLLVIAADDGPMPQTLEHLAILDLLGISKGIIALTKIDRVDDERINVVKNQIKELVMGTLLADADILEVSSTNGDGIEKLKKELWRHAEEHQSQPIEGYFRLAIDRKFSIKGAGLVVTGSVYSGTVSENDDLWLLPSRSPVRVRSIRRQNASASRGFSGDRCAINITGDFDRSLISRGSWLSNTPDLPLTNRIDAKIKILRDETKPLKNGTPVHVHCGAAHATGRLATLDDKQILPGQSGLVQLILEEPMNVCWGDRLIIRDQAASRTLGGGWVVDPFAAAKGRAKPHRIDVLNALQTANPQDRLNEVIKCSADGYPIKQFEQSANVRLATAANPNIRTSNDRYFLGEHVENLIQKISQCLEAFHASNPDVAGMAKPDIRKYVDTPTTIFDFAMNQLVDTAVITRDGQLYKLTQYAPSLSPAAQKFWEKLEPLLTDEPTKPPVIHDLAKRLGLPPTAVEKLLDNLLKAGLIVRPVKNRVFLPRAVSALKQQAIALAEKSVNGQFTVIEFRDLTGIGRNLCIEMLEHFDNTGFCKRFDNHRIIQDKSR